MCGVSRYVLFLAAVTVGALVIAAVVFLVVKPGSGAESNDDSNAKPRVYEYYTKGGVKAGLTTTRDDFVLNGKNISLHSGSMHYFRIHPLYWRDRLKKLRAAGFVAVETYVPWNLHEPYEGTFDFGKGGDDMSPFLDIATFIKIAQEEDLLVIVRPGPYICAEWEFGGLPSWLLRHPQMKVRSSDAQFMTYVQRYFDHLLPIFVDLQFTKGGPIIAFQIENEYGNVREGENPTDKEYLKQIQELFQKHDLVELYFTSDTPSKGREDGALPEVLQTANFDKNVKEELTMLKKFQPNKAAMVMEFWTGWFDHWGEKHHFVTNERFSQTLEEILTFPSGVNFYMFHGGTSFGFLNGGNVFKTFPYYLPDISSYDYDAPLSESGDYTPKYESTRTLLAKYQKVDLHLPNKPAEAKKTAYEPLMAMGFMGWNNLIQKVDKEDREYSEQAKYMEMLSVNGGSGQSYGYVVYRKTNQPISKQSSLEIRGQVKGAAMVVIDGSRKSKPLTKIQDITEFGYWSTSEGNNILPLEMPEPRNCVLDVVVENWGRNNFGKLSTDFNEVKGLTKDQLILDGQVVKGLEIISLQFKGNWVRSLTNWELIPDVTDDLLGPIMIKFELNIAKTHDTFLDMRGWGKGVVFLNGFNLGRYSAVGPQRSLYIPAPLLKSRNEIMVFEHFKPQFAMKFSDKIIYEDANDTIAPEL